MTRQTSKIIAYAALSGLVAGLACGCCKNGCTQNEKAGLATIVCQPVDISVAEHDPATFEVQVKGRDLVYQWYFKDGPVSEGMKGGRTNSLTVSDLTTNKQGYYWCEIDSSDPVWGAPVRTRTRAAKLTILPASVAGGLSFTGTNVIMDIPPTPNLPPPGSPSGADCGDYCTYVVYNNNGTAYKPDLGTTKFVAKVQAPLGTYVSNADYELLRAANLTDRFCATNIGTIQKGFGSTPSKRYVFTVYFKPGKCPPTNTYVYLEVDWQ